MGDYPGHPFRGNQYSKGKGGGFLAKAGFANDGKLSASEMAAGALGLGVLGAVGIQAAGLGKVAGTLTSATGQTYKLMANTPGNRLAQNLGKAVITKRVPYGSPVAAGKIIKVTKGQAAAAGAVGLGIVGTSASRANTQRKLEQEQLKYYQNKNRGS